jgi:parallel beta-helix repeat protein
MLSGNSYAKQADNAKEDLVDCGLPNASLQGAIDNASGPTTIFITGICSDATITKDDITLNGAPGGTVSGTISFVGAHRGATEFLTVTGPGNGISVRDGASVTITNNTIEYNEACGIQVIGGSFARVEENLVTGNGQGIDCSGLEVTRGATVFTRANKFTDNYSSAIMVGSNGYLQGGERTPPDADMDIIVQKGCTEDTLYPATCGAAGTWAVDLNRNANVNFRKACIVGTVEAYDLTLLTAFHSNIAGRIQLQRNAVMRSRKGSIEGDIKVRTGSVAMRQGSELSINGTIICDSTAVTQGLSCGDTFTDTVPSAATRCDDLYPFGTPD